ncbi:ATP-binding protein [Streptomyces sp. AcH 505]|uniref:AAA family ATPase n=1 Tax=Streptomyces sp. AcH 505 TaxID=352211 RepID=UPI000694FBC0
MEATVTDQSMMCLAAPPGAGKTFTLHTVLDQHPTWQTIRLLPRPQARPDDIRRSLHHALDLPGPPPKDPGISDDLIRNTLHHPPRLLIVDEAHQLSASCQEYLRYLYDDPRTQLAVVLAVSSHRLRTLRTTPVLASRVANWHDLHPLTEEEIPTVIPAFHPHWRTASPDVLLHLNHGWAHGNFRRWATLTHRSISIARRTGHTAHDPAVLMRRLTAGPHLEAA